MRDKVIVRVVQARIAARDVAAFNALFRAQVDLLRDQPGLEYVKLARQLQPDGAEHILLFEEWRSTADVYHWVGPDLGEPRLVAGARELMTGLKVTHYEALDLEPAADLADERASTSPTVGRSG